MAAVNRNADFLSSLPDPLVTAILSFVPFKEAARTSVLAHRWRHTWRSTRTIEFNESFFVNRNDTVQNQAIQKQAFVNFTREFLGTYTANSLDEFKLKFSKPNHEDFRNDVVGMVTFAATRNPRVLLLDFSDPAWHEHSLEDRAPEFILPDVVLGHQNANLESLTLFSCGFSRPQLLGSTSLARLKELSLGWTELRIRHLMPLVSGCPRLQALSLKKCWNMDYVDVTVRSGSVLEQLVLDKCNCFNYHIQIDAPKLKKLKYSGPVGNFVVDVAGCFEEADLDFGLELGFGENGHLIYNLLLQISHVRVLSVCSYLLQDLPHGEEPMKMEVDMNVHRLILKTEMHENELCGVAFLLNSCPFLQCLQINITRGQIFEDYDFPYDFEGFYIYRCVTSSMRIVEMNGYRGTDEENYILRYMIEHGRVMERVSINVSVAPGFNRADLLEQAQQFLLFQRASQDLEIFIS